MSKFLLILLLNLGIIGIIKADGQPSSFFASTDALLSSHVQGGRIDYARLKSNKALNPLVQEIAEINLNSLAVADREAFLINAYNLLVIQGVLDNYPLASVLDVNAFFDNKKWVLGGKKVSLNQLEKEILLKEFPDARLHFVLVCGALGCPPITSFAYRPERLDAQLDQQTRLALNNPNFIRQNGNTAELSQIFEWYAKDFGGSKNVLNFINSYRNEPFPLDAKVSFYTYDWSLNKATGRAAVDSQPAENQGSSSVPGGGNNSLRYVVSAAIPQGTAEIKIFNNLYSQEAAGERSSFFTSTASVVYGLTNRFNIGFDLRYRRVRYDEAGQANNFDVFSSDGASSFRQAVPTIGPKIRVAPFNSLPNFSIQSAFWIPIANDLTGAETGQRFFDFDGPTWFTQFFNDFPIGDNFSAFAEIDLLIEDIGSSENGRINRTSTPVTGIFSYFPNPMTTLYALGS
ncbi:MAG: DUF547 domain-containing protein, partial [Bacteroidota bacterium]